MELPEQLRVEVRLNGMQPVLALVEDAGDADVVVAEQTLADLTDREIDRGLDALDAAASSYDQLRLRAREVNRRVRTVTANRARPHLSHPASSPET